MTFDTGAEDIFAEAVLVAPERGPRWQKYIPRCDEYMRRICAPDCLVSRPMLTKGRRKKRNVEAACRGTVKLVSREFNFCYAKEVRATHILE